MCKQKTAGEIRPSLVGPERCIRERAAGVVQGEKARTASAEKQANDRIKLDMLKAALEAERTKEQQAAAAAKPKPKGKKE